MILITKPQKDYELIDSGDGEKLERFGDVILSRPDPQALWPKALSESEWGKVHALYKKAWEKKKSVPAEWNIELENLVFKLKLSSFKHVGVFPEQMPNWQWIRDSISKSKREISVLNLCGYTGGATLAALSAGATVTHVDGSKVAINWAKENAKLSSLETKPVRWILDDISSFVSREIRRGNKYDAVLMDPPAFGRGPHGEIWKIEKDFLPLLSLLPKILSDQPLFVLLNGYASGYSSLAYENSLRNIMAKYEGKIESGELAIESSQGNLLPGGIFARWIAKK